MDANQTAVEPDIVKMLSIADSCRPTNATMRVYDNQTRSVGSIVSCWKFKIDNMLIYQSRSLNIYTSLANR